MAYESLKIHLLLHGYTKVHRPYCTHYSNYYWVKGKTTIELDETYAEAYKEYSNDHSIQINKSLPIIKVTNADFTWNFLSEDALIKELIEGGISKL